MWCDRQPGSQPSISANEHDLFAGLGGGGVGGAVGCERRMILTGLFAFLPSFSLLSVLGVERREQIGCDGFYNAPLSPVRGAVQSDYQLAEAGLPSWG